MKPYQVKLKFLAMTMCLFNIFQYSVNAQERFINNQEEKIPIEKIDFGYCFNKIKDSIVIDNEQAYSQLKKQYFANCKNHDFPMIDFNKNTLIGSNGLIPYGDNGCNPLFLIQVTRDNHNQIYHHSLLFYGDFPMEGCHVYPIHHSWILVPKLPQGFTVKFTEGKDSSLIIYSGYGDYY